MVNVPCKMIDELYPDVESRNKRLAEIESELPLLKSRLDELILEKDILMRLDIFEKYLNKEVKLDLKYEDSNK